MHRDFGRIASPFEGELVRLRAMEEEDLAVLNEMFNDPDVLSGLEVAFPQSLEGIKEWFRGARAADREVHFVIETLEGDTIGECALRGMDNRARDGNLGIWVGKPYWDTGYGTDAVRTLCRFGFQHMGLARITLHVFERNPRGRRAYEKVGFKLEGTIREGMFLEGRRVDVHVMGLLPEELYES